MLYNVTYIALLCIYWSRVGIQLGSIEELSAPLIVSFDDDRCIAHLRYCHLVARLNLDATVLVPSLLSAPFKANAKVVDPYAPNVPRPLP